MHLDTWTNTCIELQLLTHKSKVRNWWQATYDLVNRKLKEMEIARLMQNNKRKLEKLRRMTTYKISTWFSKVGLGLILLDGLMRKGHPNNESFEVCS
ncbi:hypothetical protein Syun_001779 [Stephania yunnanensis]|uniref:Uncharacterized protein n=1 Tax=Stephania yunnanensis TaxID=152371 RepID=A0AAP0LK72_9MAGN